MENECPGVTAIVNTLAKLWDELNLDDGTYKPKQLDPYMNPLTEECI